jgi:hypothetical protein
MRTLTLRLADGSSRWMEVGDELQIAISDELLRKRNFKYSIPRPPLDASFLLEVLCAVALLHDSLPSARVFPIDGVVWVTGDRR